MQGESMGVEEVEKNRRELLNFEDSFAIFYEAVAADRLQSTLPVLIFD